MRKLAVQGMLAAALCAGLAVTATAAEDDDTPPAHTGLAGWWDGLFAAKEKPPEKAEKKKKVEVVEKPVGPSASERAERDRRREYEAWFRRMAVCDRLMEIAFAKNDLDMQRRVEELMEQVTALYEQRTAGLGGGEDDEVRKPRERTRTGGARGGKPAVNTGEGE